MNQFMRTVVTFGILVVLLFGLYFFASWFSKTTGYVMGEDEKVKLAQCIGGNGGKFYVSATCPACDLQKDIFGETALRFLDIIECESVSDCPEGGVPAWELNAKVYYGFKDLNELIEISGCEISDKLE